MSGSITAREAVLARIRAALAGSGDDRARRAAVRARLGAHPRNTIPQRASVSGEAALALLTEMLTYQGADVSRAANPTEAVASIAEYLSARDLPLALRMGADPILAALPWEHSPALEHCSGPAQSSDTASLSRAAVAAAETGTLFLVSGPEDPTTLNFLPETHTVLLRAKDIVGSYEDAFDRLRAAYGEAMPPRALNMISGPSRTGDIEQTIIRGAHGPKRLHVVILGPQS